MYYQSKKRRIASILSLSLVLSFSSHIQGREGHVFKHERKKEMRSSDRSIVSLDTWTDLYILIDRPCQREENKTKLSCSFFFLHREQLIDIGIRRKIDICSIFRKYLTEKDKKNIETDAACSNYQCIFPLVTCDSIRHLLMRFFLCVYVDRYNDGTGWTDCCFDEQMMSICVH